MAPVSAVHLSQLLSKIACWRDTCESLSMDAAGEGVRYAQAAQGDRAPCTGPAMRATCVYAHVDDPVDCAMRYRALGHRPVVVVPVTAGAPGGAVAAGGDGPEESVFRRTDVYRAAETLRAPFADGEVVYLPRVSVIKCGEAEGWRRVRGGRCPRVAVVAFPRPKTLRSEPRLDAALADRARTALHAAAANGHDVVVWGCPARLQGGPEDLVVAAAIARVVTEHRTSAFYAIALCVNVPDALATYAAALSHDPSE